MRTDLIDNMVDWLTTLQPDPPFTGHPDWPVFSDATDEELASVEDQMRERESGHADVIARLRWGS